MTGLTAIILGGVFGAAVSIAVRALRPARPALADALTLLDTTEAGAPRLSAVALAARLGLPSARISADLVVIETDPDAYLRRLARTTAAAFASPILAAGALAVAGTGPGMLSAIVTGLALALVATHVVNASVRSAAADQRKSYRRALAVYLGLVAMKLAAGSGVEAALYRSAAAGHGREFAAIRAALHRAAVLHQTPWDALGALGARIGVPAWEQLGATAGMAGADGARVRASLAARSRALRGARQAEDEADNNTATEQMSLGIVLISLGFLIIIGYLAVAKITTGL